MRETTRSLLQKDHHQELETGNREGDGERSGEMEPSAPVYRPGALLLLTVILVAAASSASAIGDNCAACKAVAVSSLYSFSFFLEFIGA
jgi:hypothetical protein